MEKNKCCLNNIVGLSVTAHDENANTALKFRITYKRKDMNAKLAVVTTFALNVAILNESVQID